MEVPTPKSKVARNMPPVGPGGNPVMPKYPSAKYASQAQQGTGETRVEQREISATEDMGPEGHAGGGENMSTATETSEHRSVLFQPSTLPTVP